VRLSRLLCDASDDLQTVQVYAMVLPDFHTYVNIIILRKKKVFFLIILLLLIKCFIAGTHVSLVRVGYYRG